MSRVSQVFVSGSIAYDRIMEFGGRFKEHLTPESLDHLSVSFTVNTFNEGFGGTAGNIAYNLALIGEKPTILATAGNDFDKYRAWLDKCGIDPSSISIAQDVPTASAYMTTDIDDNQIASFYLGAMVRLYDQRVDIPADAIAIISPGNNADMANLAQSYRSHGIRYLYDPGQQSIMLSQEDLRAGIRGAEVLFANEYEMGIIADRTAWKREEILAMVPIAIVTLAEKGTMLFQNGKETQIPAVAVDHAVDPTGAGDAYRAGYIKGMIAGLPVETCVRLASAVAAYAVEKKGTQNHSFTIVELKERYQTAFKETITL